MSLLHREAPVPENANYYPKITCKLEIRKQAEYLEASQDGIQRDTHGLRGHWGLSLTHQGVGCHIDRAT